MRNLANLANMPIVPGSSSGNFGTNTYFFDGVNDYIQSDAVIGRTGYDMNVSGNVTTGSDSDGSYMNFNGSYRRDLTTGSNAKISGASYAISQAGSFSCSCTFKVSSLAIDNNTSGLFGISSVCSIYMTNNSGGAAFRIRNGASFVDVNMSTLSIGTLYKCHLVYDASVTKIYCYVDGVLQNSGGTSVGFSFSGSGRSLGDDGVGGGNHTSSNKYIYHACIRNKALTQAEIDADIALGNTTKQDPSIISYYVPENLNYNTQYTGSPKDLSIAPRSLSGTSSVTANTTVAPDGTTTADTLQITGTATQGIDNPNLTITGSNIASKTFIVKAFVKVATGTALFRLKMSHRGVADYFSADLTATTDRQEFTFTQAFTSSTSGTGIVSGIVNSTGVTNPLLQIRNVRCYLTNEILRDESPNIGGFVGWKKPIVLSSWVKPNINALSNTTSQTIIQIPWIYIHLRGTTNIIYFRSETALEARAASLAGILGTNFTDKVHIAGVRYWDGTGWIHNLYINGILVTGSQTAYTRTINPAQTIYRTNASVGLYTMNYFSGNIRDTRLYTFTGSYTGEDIMSIYNGGEPTSAGFTKYMQYGPNPLETGTQALDMSTNARNGTLTGGVARVLV